MSDNWALSEKNHNEQKTFFMSSYPCANGFNLKPIFESSWILEPSKSFGDLEPCPLTQMKVFFGCLKWKAI